MKTKISTSLVASFLLATTNLFSAQNLEPISITSATKTTQSIKDVTSNVEVITKEDIEEKHFTSVNEALNTLSGVGTISNGGIGQTSSVFLRGFSSGKVLVLIDGIRYNDVTGLSGAPFEHLMVEDIEQIEVIKGAQSGIWGADASAGVINIITKNAKDGTHGNAKVEYGSFNTKKYNIGVSHKNKDFYVKGNVSKLTSDGFSASEPKKSSVDYGKRGEDLGWDKDGYENITANLKAGYYIDDSNKIDLSHTLINAKADFDSGAGSDGNNNSKTNDKFSSVAYENKNSFVTTEVFAKKSTFDRELNYPVWSSKYEYNGEVKEYGFKSDVPYYNDNSFVVLGADYKTFEHKNDLNEKYNNKGFFLTNSNKFFDNTIFTQSVRADNYDKFEDKTTGKIGLKHYITDDLEVSSNYGTAYNVPTLYQLFEPSSPWGKVGNANLKPENVKSKDIGFAYKGFNATYFHNEIKDMIDWLDGFENLDGTSKIKGYELAYKKDVLDDTFLTLAYTKLNAKDKNGKDLVSRAKDSVKYGVDYYGIARLHLGINGEYVGDRADYSTAQTGNYTLWNGVANYQIDKTFSTYLKVNNIFDKFYQTVDGYGTAKRSGYVGIEAKF